MKTWARQILRGIFLIILFTAVHPAYAFFDPSIGRWVSRDPIGEQGGQNVYAFAENNGVSRIDSLGLATLRFEVIVGDFNIWAGSGTWSQPFWAGNGDYGLSGSSAWSSITLNNEASFWDLTHHADDYCNTVQAPSQPNGTKSDAGSIRVYAKDECGGLFHINGLYNASLAGSGPNAGYGFAVLTAVGSKLSDITISPKSPMASPMAAISKDVTLKPKVEKLVVEYRPTLTLKNRELYGGVPAYVSMTAFVSLDIQPK
jgi:uncharacterized protein RhaS with RHS repeats